MPASDQLHHQFFRGLGARVSLPARWSSPHCRLQWLESASLKISHRAPEAPALCYHAALSLLLCLFWTRALPLCLLWTRPAPRRHALCHRCHFRHALCHFRRAHCRFRHAHRRFCRALCRSRLLPRALWRRLPCGPSQLASAPFVCLPESASVVVDMNTSLYVSCVDRFPLG